MVEKIVLTDKGIPDRQFLQRPLIIQEYYSYINSLVLHDLMNDILLTTNSM